MAMAMLPVSVSKKTSMLKRSQKIGVNSQASVDKGSAPGWAGASGTAAGGIVGAAEGAGDGVGAGDGDVTADAPRDGSTVVSGENCGVQAAMAKATTIDAANGTSSCLRRTRPMC